MQPISSRNRNLHRGPATSKEFNSIRNDLHHDLYALFSLANDHDELIKHHMDVLIRENYFLQNRITQLETAIEGVKENILLKQTGDRKQKNIQSFYSLENILEMDSENHRAHIDTLYGVATLNDTNRISKASLKSESKEVVIPSSLLVTLYESNNTRPIKEDTGKRDYYLVADQNFNTVFDQNKNTFWTRTVSFEEDKSINEVYGILHIKLPIDSLNDINVNTLTINPYPEYSMEILDIQYKGVGAQWYHLPNYPMQREGDRETPMGIKDAGKLLFSFAKTEMTEIQIFFKQPYWFKNQGNREFIYGFQDIGIENRVYGSEESHFVTVFSLEGTTKGFQRINQPTIIPAIGTPIDVQDLVEHRIFYNRELTNESSFGQEILAPIQKVYIQTTIRKDGDRVPTLRQIQLDYQYQDVTN